MVTPVELRDREGVGAWLAAGLCLTRVVAPAPELVPVGCSWISALLAERASLPPPGVVVDLGQLLLGEPLGLGARPEVNPRLAPWLRRYEDHLLGRLLRERRLDAAVDAVARLPERLRPAAVGLFVAQLLDRLGFVGGVEVSSGALRQLSAGPADELLSLGMAHLRLGDAALAALREGYEALVAGAGRTGSLLGAADVFALRHLVVLQGFGQRVAARQVLDVAEALDRALPSQLKPRRHASGSLPTRLQEASAYPSGGFAGIAHSGSLENLVISELMWMNDDPAVDLFDLRYTEGELLYYTRDESVLLRRRRSFFVVLGPSLVAARFKEKGSRWQRLVIVLGQLVCLIRRLIAALDREEICVRVVFVQPAGEGPLDAEAALLGLLLGEWVDQGLVELRRVGDGEQALALATSELTTGEVDLIWVGLPLPDQHDPRLLLHSLVVAPPSDEEPWRGWVARTLELLQALV